MLQSIALILFGLITLVGTSHAAVLITFDDQGHTSTDVFDNQVYYHLEDGNLDMRIDLKTNTCSMFLHDQRIHVEGKCDEAQKEIDTAMSDALKQQGMTREQVLAMRKMMQQHRQQDADIKPAGSETIAGYQATCYQMSPTRKMCISEAVNTLISREFNLKKMVRLMRQMTGGPFGREASKMDQAEQKLREKGYVMKDVDIEGGMPNAGMLKMLPEEARKRIMGQLQQAGAKPTGRVVVNIEKNASFTPKVPNYPRKSIREFTSLMMGR
ncbi:hypothetical protein [Candidatus Entotheonella palauensis]|uniref:hypothetical protein n=1 Tax=Candidatus Entotheonella palauensis TaxID=93172 RepID=UPI0004B5BC5B|nr:hypothetical protein [Candidatus Entotheonella palauensis]